MIVYLYVNKGMLLILTQNIFNLTYSYHLYFTVLKIGTTMVPYSVGSTFHISRKIFCCICGHYLLVCYQAK